MNPDFIPDWSTSALCVSGRWPVRYYLFLSKDGTFVVRHEKHTYPKRPEDNWELQDRLGYFWNIQTSLPAKVTADFKAAIVDFNAMAPPNTVIQ